MRDLKVLLVEDNEADIILTSEILSSAGIDQSITITRDGAEAIQFIKKEGRFENEQTHDLVLLDINLPKISGKEVLSFIKNHNEYKSIPVIIYTSSDLEKDIIFCYDAGAELYLNKTHSMESFDKVVRLIREFAENHYLN
jgi:CheY-like chemotaxis protein